LSIGGVAESDEYLAREFEYVDKKEADKYFASPWWLQGTAADRNTP